MRRWVLAAITAALVCSPASAATPQSARMFKAEPPLAGGCGAQLSGGGRPLGFPGELTEELRSGLSAAVFLALHDATGAGAWPAAAIDAAPPCPVARFEADDVVWTISAGDGRAPPRWIRSAARPYQWFYLARSPALADAEAWSRTRQGLAGATQPPTYLLVGAGEDLHFVFTVYDGPPEASQLADDTAAAIERRSSPVAVYDLGGDAVTLFLPTASGAQAEIFRPAALNGERVAVLYLPDGRLFSKAAGAVVMRGSGFACADRYGDIARDRLMVLRPEDAGLDLACRFSGEESYFTVFVTHLPDARQDRQRFAHAIRQAEAEAGVLRRLSRPPTGKDAPLQAGSAWLDKAQHGQALLFARRGEYVVEVRATHTLDETDAIWKALGALLDQLVQTKS